MSVFLYFLIPVVLLAVAVVLGVGLYSLAKGGTFARENSNRLMRWRVILQAIAVGLILLFLLVTQGGNG